MNIEKQIEVNNKLAKELKRLEKKRNTRIKRIMDMQREITEINTDIGQLRRQVRIVSVKKIRPATEYKQKLIKEVGKCEQCGLNVNLTVHHKKQLSQGGTNERNNLEVLCLRCHKQKHPITEQSIIGGVDENKF